MALARDTYLEVVPLLDEAVPSFVFSHNIERFDNGQVSGEISQPGSRTRRIFKFDGISNKSEALVSPLTFRSLLNYYNSGGQVRVYRLYPAVVTPWSETSEFGYNDIVSNDANGSDYPYYTPSMTQFSFSLTGLEVA